MIPPRRLGFFVVALMLCSLAPAAQAQAPTAPGVEIDCDEKQPELNVHPLNDPVIDITCTVKNPSSFQESISVDKEWEGLEVDMMLEEDTFDLGPGDPLRVGQLGGYGVGFKGLKEGFQIESRFGVFGGVATPAPILNHLP